MKKKIFYLADVNNAHIVKLLKNLPASEFEIVIFGLVNLKDDYYKEHSNIKIITGNISEELDSKESGSPGKVLYLKSIRKIKQIIKEFKPDILHAHYAASYGLFGALSDFHPFILSVWGEDVFSFPANSYLKTKLLSFVLRRADKVLSTSEYLKTEAKKYCDCDILVTPFGIDTEMFSPEKPEKQIKLRDVTIGTVKHLEKIYGIEGLINAFAVVQKTYPETRLLIVGGGTQYSKLIKLVHKLHIENKVKFTGRIDYDEVVGYHRRIDIEVYNSERESFGVATLEAMACGNPVIVSNVGGLKEITENSDGSVIVGHNEIIEISSAIIELIGNKLKMSEMSKKAREHVKRKYSIKSQIKQLTGIYREVSR